MHLSGAIEAINSLSEVLERLSDFIWSYPLAILLLGTGVFLTIILRGIQFRKLWHALYLAFFKRKEKHDEEGDITHFQALMTALAATVGTGNIVGVATAIAIGGPGALFWMWITGLLGMATKYSEAILGVKFRKKNRMHAISGGPMYYIEQGLGWKWLAVMFAFFGAIAAAGPGNMVQSNSIADVLHANIGFPIYATAIILMMATGLVILGGIKSIGKVTSTMVPVMILLYLVSGLLIIVSRIDAVPAALLLIIKQAFTQAGAIGGFAGSAVMLTIRMGIARGLFSNESGLGSGPIAAAAAKTKNPVTQALISMTQTFIDTIIICSITGLVLIITGAWNSGINGAALTSYAFQLGIPGIGKYIVMTSLVLFAFSTIVGWCYYGEKCLEYLFSYRIIRPYRYAYIIAVGLGAVLNLEIVWAFADISNALMAFPNLIALLALSPIIVSETKRHLKD